MRSGLLVYEQLLDLPLFLRFHREALAEYPRLAGTRLLYDALRRMLSEQVYDLIAAVTQWLRLRAQLYRHRRVAKTTEAAKQVVHELFDAYTAQPEQMPLRHAERQPAQQAIADYIAGMTDRFALREHARLYGAGRSHFPGLG